MAKVSVITPAYNAAKYISKTIESIQAQTFSDWELIIVDDASKDDTCSIVESFAKSDSRIKLIRLEKNSGAAVARNKALDEAGGRFIAFCDSDDIWLKEKLQKQIAFMEEKACGLSYTSYYRCKEDGTPYRLVECREKTSFKQICRFNTISCVTAMYDTAITGKVPIPNIRKRQDWALWIKVLQKCGMAYGIKEPLAYYRILEKSLSSGKMSNIEYNIKVFTDVLGYSKFRAVLHYFFVTMPNKL